MPGRIPAILLTGVSAAGASIPKRAFGRARHRREGRPL